MRLDCRNWKHPFSFLPNLEDAEIAVLARYDIRVLMDLPHLVGAVYATKKRQERHGQN
jgi:hypothetical protein